MNVLKIIFTNFFFLIRLITGYEQGAHQNLTEAFRNLRGAFTVYRKDEVPERWHIKKSRRMSDLMAVAKIPNTFYDDQFIGKNFSPSLLI